MIHYVIGVDPGPTPGIVRLILGGPPRNTLIIERTDIVQCTSGVLVPVLNALIDFADFAGSKAALAYEAFVVGHRASRSSTPAAGTTTREMVALLIEWAATANVLLYARRATDVKPWATDERLDAAGLLEPTKGMRHARDAARHALFTAVKHYGLPDPLSRKGRAA